MLTKTDMHYFVKASQVAEISDFAKINIGCIAVYQGTIIGVGFNTNKTHPYKRNITDIEMAKILFQNFMQKSTV